MDAALLISALAVLASGALLGLVAVRNRRPERLQTLELRFGGDVTTGAVEAALAGIAGLPIRSQVVLDVVADRDGIRHRLHAPAATIDVIKGHLRGVLPSARLDAVDGDDQAGFSYGVRLGWRDRHPLLQTGTSAETAAALLGSLASPLGKDEAVMVRWTLSPARGPHLPVDAGRRPRGQRGLLEALWPSARPLPPEQINALRNKYRGAVLHGTPTVLVRASDINRAAHLAGRVTSVFRSRGGVRGVLRVRRLSARQIAAGPQRLALRLGDRLGPAELAPLLGWPIDRPRIAGLTWRGPRRCCHSGRWG